MIHIPSIPRTFLELLGLSIRHHFAVFKKTIWLIVLMVVVKDLYIYIGGMPKNPVWLYLVGIVIAVLLIYLLMTMLYMTNRILHGEYVTLSEAFFTIRKRAVPLYSASVIFVIVPILLVILAEFFVHLVGWMGADRSRYSGLIFVLVVGLPIMYGYLRYFYTMPLIVMEDFPLWNAFREASMLIKKNWIRVLGLYACAIAIWLLVSPDTLHGHLMKAYHISAPFDFVVFCVTLPIVMNLVVFIRNDLRLRQAEHSV